MTETTSPEIPTSDYPYSGPERLQRRKPYSFSPYGGATFLTTWARDRAHLVETLQERGARLEAEVAGIDRLARDADAMSPARQAALAEEMDHLQEEWESAIQESLARTAPLIESLLLPYLVARVPLRPREEGPAWAHAVLLRLLERFEAFGCVHAAYDARWRKTESSPNEPQVVVRLALAAAWLSWSELIVDRPASLAHLNVLLKVNDLVDAGIHHGGWELDDREQRWVLAALALERRLVVHWQRSRGLAD